MPRGSKPKIYPHSIVERVRKLYSAGHTQVEIAKELRTTQKVVWRLMHHHNIKTRTAAKRNQLGKTNHSWKGKEASYQAKHIRVAVARGKPKECEVCGTKDQAQSFDWACVTGDLDDVGGFIRMCRSCHWKNDGTINNIKHMREGYHADFR